MTAVPVLILVTGHPGTDKTTLARKIAEEFSLPVIAKDDIKERLFDILGWSDRAWGIKLGHATYALMQDIAVSFLTASVSLIIESNFNVDIASTEFAVLQERVSFDILQVICFADKQILLDRFHQRATSGERHPGHVDHLGYAELETRLEQGHHSPLDIGGETIWLDTTDLAAIDYKSLNAQIRNVLTNVPHD